MFKTNYIEASRLRGVERHCPALKSSACIAALNAYKENILRHSALLALPGYASLTAATWATASITAQVEIIGLHPKSEAQIKAAGPAIVKRKDFLMDRNMQGSNEEKRKHLSALTIQFEEFASRSGHVYSDVLETVLKVVMILAWGSFEALVSDLHHSALKEHPLLFNLTGKEKFRFQKRQLFREAYLNAFVSDNGAIQNALNHESIDALCAIRNLLVHKAGIVDEFFLKECVGAALLAPFISLTRGSKIRIDGPSVLAIVDPALESGYALIEAVDGWLTSSLQSGGGTKQRHA